MFVFCRMKRGVSDDSHLVIHEDKLAVATSPCLYNIRYDVSDDSGNHANVTLNMVSEMEANPKDVIFSTGHPESRSGRILISGE